VPDLAQFGIVVPPVQGKEEAKKALREIGDEGAASAKKVTDSFKGVGTGLKQAGTEASGSAGGFESLATSLARNAGGLGLLLRAIGPLGGSATMMASQMERGVLATEKMATMAASGAAQSRILNKAFDDGAISAATMAAAQEKLVVMRQAAARAELEYAAAQRASAAAQAATLGRVQVGTGLLPVPVALTGETESRRASAAITEEAAAKKRLDVINKELAASQVTVNEAERAAATGIGGTVAIIGAAIGVLIALGIAIMAVKKAWDLLRDSVREAAAQQTAAFPLQQLIGNADQAKQKIGELRSLWETSGVLPFDDLAKAASQLVLIGTGADNLIPRLKSMSEIAVATGGNVEGVVSAYERMRSAIERGTDVQLRGMGAASASTIALVRALMDETGKSEDQIHRMFRDRTITIELLNKAIADATAGTGRFADAISSKAQTMDGAFLKMLTVWHSVQDALGAPIRDALAPLFAQIGVSLEKLKPLAEEIGARIAHLVDAFAQVAANEGWKAAILSAWTELIKRIGDIISTGIGAAFTSMAESTGHSIAEMGRIDADGYTRAYNEAIESGSSRFSATMTGVLGAIFADLGVMKAKEAGTTTGQDFVMASTNAITQGKDAITRAADDLFSPLNMALAETDSTLKKFGLDFKNITSGGFNVTTAGRGVGGGLPASDIATGFMGKSNHAAFQEAENDIALYNDYWYKYSQIQATATTATENTRRVLELQDKTLKEMRDPSQFTDIGSQWQRMEAEKVLAEKAADEAIKNGSASTLTAIERGISKLSSEWGNWAQTVEKLTVDIGKSLASDISTGLTDILTGTKSVSQGFAEMAAAILRDIARIIIQMLVMKAITATLGSVFGGLGGAGGGISAGGAHAGATVGAGWSFVRNVDPIIFMGAPRLHSGLASDEYPAILQRGEQVIPRGGGSGGNVNSISISIVNHGDGRTSRDVKTNDANDARELGRVLEAAMDQWGIKQKRKGGLFNR
jgi:hypothetical protein